MGKVVADRSTLSQIFSHGKSHHRFWKHHSWHSSLYLGNISYPWFICQQMCTVSKTHEALTVTRKDGGAHRPYSWITTIIWQSQQIRGLNLMLSSQSSNLHVTLDARLCIWLIANVRCHLMGGKKPMGLLHNQPQPTTIPASLKYQTAERADHFFFVFDTLCFRWTQSNYVEGTF